MRQASSSRWTLGLGFLLACAQAGAQVWPAEPIHWIVPFSAGGPTDVLSRYVANRVSMAVGKPVLVENVLGASGSIGLDRVARSKPDGYTIATTANTLQAVAPYMQKLPYDTIKSFTPLAGLATFPFVLIVNTESSMKTFDDLIRRARSAPGTVSAASAGVGTGTHLATVFLGQRTGTKFNSIQYKGSAPALNDIMGGQVDFTFDVIGSALPLIQAHKVRALATTGLLRHSGLPQVPTVAEAVPGFEFVGWFGVVGPSGMPAAVVQRLNSEINAIQRSAEFKAFAQARGYEPFVSMPAELGERIQHEFGQWGEVIASSPTVLPKE